MGQELYPFCRLLLAQKENELLICFEIYYYHCLLLRPPDSSESLCDSALVSSHSASDILCIMLSRISRNATLKSQRTCRVSTCETRRKFVQPSSLNRASVIDPPPLAVRDNEQLFRPRAGKKMSFYCSFNTKNYQNMPSDMLGFTLGKRESTEKARPIYLDFQVCLSVCNSCLSFSHIT